MLLPDVLLLSADDRRVALPLATDSVLCCVWESRFGSILIEIVGNEVFVNGQRVEPHVQ